MTTTGQPPHDLDTERAVLGAAMIGDQARGALTDLGVDHDAFYAPAHAALWRAMAACDAAGHPVDVATAVDTVRRHPDWMQPGVTADDVRAAAWQATETVTAISDLTRHGEILLDVAARRRILGVTYEIQADALRGDRPAAEVLADAEQRLLGAGRRDRRLVTIASDAIDAAIPEWEAPAQFRGVATGLRGVDALLRGLRPGQLVVLGARPSMGKSTLALDIGRHVAIRGGVPVLIASLEMSGDELAARLVASEGAIPGRRLTHDGADPEHWERVIDISSDPRIRNVMWTDQPDLSANDVAALARRVAARHAGGLGLLIVDYLQLLRPADPRAMPVTQVAEMSRALKIAARTVGCPVIALSQLSRANEARVNKRPMLSDLRDSGAIEQDADVVLFVHRDDYYDEDAPPGIAELIIAKNRNGPLGTARLLLQAAYPRFVDAPTRTGGPAGTAQPPPPPPPPPAGGIPLPDLSRTR